MELLTDLGTRLVNNKWVRYGIFKCSFCFQEVERRLCDGLRQKSCGCYKTKHGESNTRLYQTWMDMKYRCSNSKVDNYKYYGGRGITICPEWANDYTKFRDWSLNNGYTEGLQIHRENDGNYEPYNCEWVTNTENARHRRGQKIKNIEMANEIRELEKIGNHTRKELAEKYGVSQMQISNIINNKKWGIK